MELERCSAANVFFDAILPVMCFPLIQYALAQSILAVPNQEVSVGVYDFASRQAALTSFSAPEIAQARTRLSGLLRALTA